MTVLLVNGMQSWREQAGEGRERKGGREYEADESLTACGPCSLTCIALFMTGSLATAHIEQASPHIITTLVSRFSKGLVYCLDSRADDAALDSAYLTVGTSQAMHQHSDQRAIFSTTCISLVDCILVILFLSFQKFGNMLLSTRLFRHVACQHALCRANTFPFRDPTKHDRSQCLLGTSGVYLAPQVFLFLRP
jgi:hypothetical protein